MMDNDVEIETTANEFGDVGIIRPGDIVQYETTTFQERDEDGQLTGVTVHPNPYDLPPGKSHTSYFSISDGL
jgi:hypothetical protein